ncbi:DUF5105 domain-containing protein [Clostridium sp. MB40-C1]|uniref:DUF5105 domain-containing protein n=1 Tax=Clostridium sp. MB40-C1 TaxID=3070996 RepID=UPI0027DFF306|nr:DUF5105 domain-containing protein [Clostridium sp. MB40-C1]WMJ80716.1 DUF5105 domain-containing protein [Clostridium sp. MB40-C1]
MKKVKKSLVILMCLLFIPVILIGCSNKPKVSADETAKILFNFYVKGDKSDLSKISMPKDRIEELSKFQKDTIIKEIRNGFLKEGLTLKNDQLEQIYKARLEALKKVTATTEKISENDKEAEVKVKATYFDESKVSEKAMTDAVKEVEKLKLTNRQEIISKILDIYVKNLKVEYQNVKPSTDVKEGTYKFIIKEKVWVPQDVKKFASEIGSFNAGK